PVEALISAPACQVVPQIVRVAGEKLSPGIGDIALLRRCKTNNPALPLSGRAVDPTCYIQRCGARVCPCLQSFLQCLPDGRTLIFNDAGDESRRMLCQPLLRARVASIKPQDQTIARGVPKRRHPGHCCGATTDECP